MSEYEEDLVIEANRSWSLSYRLLDGRHLNSNRSH
jgi:hypothetical protein